MSEISREVPSQDWPGLDLGAALRLLLGLPQDTKDQSVVDRIRALVLEEAVARAKAGAPVLATLVSRERRSAALKGRVRATREELRK